MARPRKKDGVTLSAYVRRDLYEKLQEIRKPGESMSDIVEKALEIYLENKDIIAEFEELSTKYAELLKRCDSKSGNSLAEVIEEGITWREAMSRMGITEPKDVVSMLYSMTQTAPGSKDVRFIDGVEDYILVNPGDAKSNIDFVFKKRRKISQPK